MVGVCVVGFFVLFGVGLGCFVFVLMESQAFPQ